MSIFFSYDENLSKVEKASRLLDYKTKEWYRVYGLKQEDNPPMLIGYKKLPENKTQKEIKDIMARNGIPVVFETEKWGDTIQIGLRRDLRAQFFLAAAAVNWLIGYFEGKVIADKTVIGFPRIPAKYYEKNVDFHCCGY
jgi:hypothetical protein